MGGNQNYAICNNYSIQDGRNLTELDEDDNALTLFLTILPPRPPEAPPAEEEPATPLEPTGNGTQTPTAPCSLAKRRAMRPLS